MTANTQTVSATILQFPGAAPAMVRPQPATPVVALFGVAEDPGGWDRLWSRGVGGRDLRADSEFGRQVGTALRMAKGLVAGRLAAAARAEATDRLTYGEVVVTPDGSVVCANNAARRLCTEGGISMEGEGGLTATLQADGARLRRLVRSAATGGPGGSLRVFRGARQSAMVVRVSAMPLSQPAAALLSPPEPSALVRVTLRDLGRICAPSPVRLKELFGITAAEAALVPHLLTGDSLKVIAHLLGISGEMVRGQSRSVLAKTGAANLRALGVMMAVLGDE